MNKLNTKVYIVGNVPFQVQRCIRIFRFYNNMMSFGFCLFFYEEHFGGSEGQITEKDI